MGSTSVSRGRSTRNRGLNKVTKKNIKLFSQNEMGNRKNLIIGIGIVLLVVGVIVYRGFSGNTDEDKKEGEVTNVEEFTEEIVEETPNTEEVVEETLEEEEVIPEWYGKTYKIDSVEFEGLSYQKTNLWKSYDERTLIIAVPRYADVALRGYRSDYDYCQLEYENRVGWSACAWVKGLPKDMADYWVK